MIETINENKPLFRDSTKNIFSEAEKHDDMIEPIRGCLLYTSDAADE